MGVRRFRHPRFVRGRKVLVAAETQRVAARVREILDGPEFHWRIVGSKLMRYSRSKFHNVRFCSCGHPLTDHARVRAGNRGKALLRTRPGACQFTTCGCKQYHEKFGSQGEKNYYQELQEQERAGSIKNLRGQVNFKLLPKLGKEWPAVIYRADAVFNDADGKRHIQDFKGRRSGPAWATFRLKARLMRNLGLEIEVVGNEKTERREERREQCEGESQR